MGKDLSTAKSSNCHHKSIRIRIVSTLMPAALLLGACGAAGTNVQAAVGMTVDTAAKAAASSGDGNVTDNTDAQIEKVRALLSKEMSRSGTGLPGREEETYDPLEAMDSYNYIGYWLSEDADYEHTSAWGQDHTYRLMWCLNSCGYDFEKTAAMLMEDEDYCRFLLYIVLCHINPDSLSTEEELEILMELCEQEQWSKVIQEYREQGMTPEELYALLGEPADLFGMDTIIGISALELAARELALQGYDTAAESLSDEDILAYCEAFSLLKEFKELEYTAIRESALAADGEGDAEKAEFIAGELEQLEKMSVTNLVYGEDYSEYRSESGAAGSSEGLPFIIVPLEEGESAE